MRSLRAVQRKMFDHRADWEAIDRGAALANPRVLDLLREACLVESYLPVYTGKMMGLFWDDLDATAIFTIESIEAYSHFYLLRRYLETIGYRPITDAEVVMLRAKERRAVYRNPIRELVNFMGTEHFAAQFFLDLIDMTDEPVIKGLLPEFAEEETLHSQFAFDLLAARLQVDGSLRSEVVKRARNFRHVGAYVADVVSPAGSDNVRTIQAFNRKFEKLLGQPLSDMLVAETAS
jgi:hypothetical protein